MHWERVSYQSQQHKIIKDLEIMFKAQVCFDYCILKIGKDVRGNVIFPVSFFRKVLLYLESVNFRTDKDDKLSHMV